MEAIAGNLSPSSASYGCYCLHSLLHMNAIAGNLSLFMFLAGNLSLFTFLVIRRESIVGLPLPEARLSQSPVKGFGMVLFFDLRKHEENIHFLMSSVFLPMCSLQINF